MRALIFDFGGVLMKTVDYGPRHRWDARLGLAAGSVERVVHGSASWIQAQTGAIPVAAYWADVAAQLGLDNDAVRELAEDFYSGDRLDDALIAYIRQQREAGRAVALLSNDSPELESRLRRLDIIDLFDPLVISGKIGVMKPDAGAYRAVLDGLKRPAEDTLFIDDRADNVEGARALGITAVHYQAGMDLPGELARILYG